MNPKLRKGIVWALLISLVLSLVPAVVLTASAESDESVGVENVAEVEDDIEPESTTESVGDTKPAEMTENTTTPTETEAVAYYKVNTNLVNIGSGSGTGSCNTESAAAGTSVGVTVTPAEGCNALVYVRNESTGELTPVENNAFVMPEANVTVVFFFYKESGSIHLLLVPNVDNGKVSVNGRSGSSFGDYTVYAFAVGGRVTLNVVPSTGMELKTLSYKQGRNGASTPIEKGEDDSYSFTMPGSITYVNAEFTAQKYNVTVSDAIANGRVEITSEGTRYACGDRVQLMIQPNSGYRFVEAQAVGEETVNVDADYSFIMPDCDVEITAEFEELHISVVTEEKTVSGTKKVPLVDNSLVLTIEGDENYTFAADKIPAAGIVDEVVLSNSLGLTLRQSGVSEDGRELTIVFCGEPQEASTASIALTVSGKIINGLDDSESLQVVSHAQWNIADTAAVSVTAPVVIDGEETKTSVNLKDGETLTVKLPKSAYEGKVFNGFLVGGTLVKPTGSDDEYDTLLLKVKLTDAGVALLSDGDDEVTPYEISGDVDITADIKSVAEKIELSTDSLPVAAGSSVTVTATAKPEDASQKLNVKAADTDVADVAAGSSETYYNVTGNKAGDTTVTFSTTDSETPVTAEMAVHVYSVTTKNVEGEVGVPMDGVTVEVTVNNGKPSSSFGKDDIELNLPDGVEVDRVNYDSNKIAVILKGTPTKSYGGNIVVKIRNLDVAGQNTGSEDFAAFTVTGGRWQIGACTLAVAQPEIIDADLSDSQKNYTAQLLKADGTTPLPADEKVTIGDTLYLKLSAAEDFWKYFTTNSLTTFHLTDSASGSFTYNVALTEIEDVSSSSSKTEKLIKFTVPEGVAGEMYLHFQMAPSMYHVENKKSSDNNALLSEVPGMADKFPGIKAKLAGEGEGVHLVFTFDGSKSKTKYPTLTARVKSDSRYTMTNALGCFYIILDAKIYGISDEKCEYNGDRRVNLDPADDLETNFTLMFGVNSANRKYWAYYLYNGSVDVTKEGSRDGGTLTISNLPHFFDKKAEDYVPISIAYKANSTNGNPLTGDSVNPAVLGAVVVLCGAGIGAVVYFYKKKK